MDILYRKSPNRPVARAVNETNVAEALLTKNSPIGDLSFLSFYQLNLCVFTLFCGKIVIFSCFCPLKHHASRIDCFAGKSE